MLNEKIKQEEESHTHSLIMDEFNDIEETISSIESRCNNSNRLTMVVDMLQRQKALFTRIGGFDENDRNFIKYALCNLDMIGPIQLLETKVLFDRFNAYVDEGQLLDPSAVKHAIYSLHVKYGLIVKHG